MHFPITSPVRSTTDTADSSGELCAVFVADGIQYTLKGRVTEDTMKEIVDSMTSADRAEDQITGGSENEIADSAAN